MSKKTWLKIAAGWSFFMAVCQAVITVWPAAAIYFGAPPALPENRGQLLLWGGGAVVVLVILGLYALSGAGVIRRLPLLRLALIGISILFLLRGLFIVFDMMVIFGALAGELLPQSLISSLVFLAAGISYALGTALRWKELRPQP